MTLRHLRIFVAVCEERSMTKAGQKLFMTQPTVSFAVKELEQHYQTKLFDRISKRLYLTDAGSRLLAYARHLTSLFDELENGSQIFSGSGTLRIGTSITIGNCLLPGLLKTFSGMRPDAVISVLVDNSEKIAQAVLENRLDVGFIEGTSYSPSLISEPFQDDELVLLCAPNHRWAGQKTVKPEELLHEPVLMREKGSGGREKLESALLMQDITLTPAWESISTQAIVQAAINGLGVAILPLLLVQTQLDLGVLITRPLEGVSLKLKFTIIRHKNKYLTDAAKDLIRLCKTS